MDSFDDTLTKSDKIEILSTDDLKIKAIGELLSNDSSRMILNLISSQEMTASEISNKTHLSLELVRYHLQKMLDAGIVNISKTEKNTREQPMKYYRITKLIAIVLPQEASKKAKKSKSLFNSLSRIYKFMIISASAIISWYATYTIIPDKSAVLKLPRDSGFIPENLFWSIVITMMLIITGLTIERFSNRKGHLK